MNIQVEYHNKSAVVAPRGFVDEYTAPSLKEKLNDLIDQGVREVELDLGGVEFMDSTGVGVLLGRYKAMRAKGIDLCVSHPTKQVDKLFRLTGIYTIINAR